MNSHALRSTDREAVSQLRALLKSDQNLTPAEEEELIASFLESRERHPGPVSIQRWQRPALREVILSPGVVQAGVVGANVAAAVTFWRAMSYNCLTCGVNYGYDFQIGAFTFSPQGAFLAATVALALLPLLVLGAMLLRHPVRISGKVRLAVATFIAGNLVVGAIETVGAGWGGGQFSSATDHFIAANIVALIISLIVAAYSAIMARTPPATLIQIVYQGRQEMAAKLGAGVRE